MATFHQTTARMHLIGPTSIYGLGLCPKALKMHNQKVHMTDQLVEMQELENGGRIQTGI